MVPEGPPTTIQITVPAPRGILVVRAVDVEEAPVAGAVWSASGAIALSDQPAGEAIHVRPGTYELRATAPGYRPATESVTVELDGEATLMLSMNPARASVTKERIDIRESVYFETGRAIIKEESHALLDEVAELMIAHPELLLIRIEGHTDSRGNDSSNQLLSQRRAEAVRVFLIGEGVAETRLSSVGYGESRPLEKAETSQAWEKNRRVDFFVEQHADDTPSEEAPSEDAPKQEAPQ